MAAQMVKMTNVSRRSFLGGVGAAGLLGQGLALFAAGANEPRVGEPWPGWKTGEFQTHFIYTGRSESVFMIFPDGTTMLIDCGDYDVPRRMERQTPVLPNRSKGSGEWVARYVKRTNPFGKKVDYWMLSHWHADHAGCETSSSRREERDGDDWFVSGLAEAIDYLDFGKGFDRCWPNPADPYPNRDLGCREFSQIIRTYRYLERHRGLKIEKFQVGAKNQVALVKDPRSYPDFNVLNICGNGKILCRDGSIRNLYEDVFVPGFDSGWRVENGMSCGMILSYGKFRLYTAGDFQDFWKKPDGTRFETEDALGTELDAVDVAKTNHHGSQSMTEALVRALKARVWVTCVFATHNNDESTLRRLSSRALYAGERAICPTCYPRVRQEQDGGADWTKDIVSAAREPGHVVVNVALGGDTYTVSYLTALDESMTVMDVMRFKSGENA